MIIQESVLLTKVFAALTLVGRTASFSTGPVAGDYNPVTGAVTFTPTVYSGLISPPERYESKYIDGDLIRLRDCKIYVAASGLSTVPTLGTIITIGSRVFTVMNVIPLDIKSTTLAYEIQLRS